eukprot:c21059_g2_i1.p1 GENE.c21059_g2_i1~~c21059_g2_i1.p1  ORF type:complete len:264 (+),score=105.51 c21059_g2_i1:209-1000(+)
MGCSQGRIEKNKKQEHYEVTFLKTLKGHPNIVNFHHCISSPTTTYIIQELVESTLLEFIISHRKLHKNPNAGVCPSQAQYLFTNLIEGVSFIHSKGIAHRDIKVENCLISKSGNLVIIDFGLATTSRWTKQKCGTRRYAAPEVIRGDYYDPFKSDIWSCGVLLYVLLCGKYPFRCSNQEQFKTQHNNIIFPQSISIEAKDLLIKMLDVNPSTRITIPEIFNHPFMINTQLFNSTTTTTAIISDLQTNITNSPILLAQRVNQNG